MEFAVYLGLLLTILYAKSTRAQNLDTRPFDKSSSEAYPDNIQFLPNYNYDVDSNISEQEPFDNNTQGMIFN